MEREMYSDLERARALIRRNFVNAVFCDEPGGMKRGGWADRFAQDIANALTNARAEAAPRVGEAASNAHLLVAD